MLDINKLSPLDYRRTTMFNICTFSNPLSIFFSNNCKSVLLQESLIKTYPIDKTIRYVKDYFHIPDGLIYSIETEAGTEHIQIKVPETGKNQEMIEKAMDYCGWHLGRVQTEPEYIDGDKYKVLQFEASFEDEDDGIIYENDYLYHMSPEIYKRRILKNGLTPKCKNNMFKYPDRIYLFTDSEDVTENMPSLAKQLYNFDRNRMNNGIYVVYRIDVEKLPDNIRFYRDPNFGEGCYTRDNISPECLEVYGYVDGAGRGSGFMTPEDYKKRYKY